MVRIQQNVVNQVREWPSLNQFNLVPRHSTNIVNLDLRWISNNDNTHNYFIGSMKLWEWLKSQDNDCLIEPSLCLFLTVFCLKRFLNKLMSPREFTIDHIIPWPNSLARNRTNHRNLKRNIGSKWNIGSKNHIRSSNALCKIKEISAIWNKWINYIHVFIVKKK